MAEIDINEFLNAGESRAAQMAEVHKRVARLRGRATGGNGLVKAVYTKDGLSEFELDPRALQMDSAKLAATIKAVVRAASRDLQRKSMKLMAGVFGREIIPTANKLSEVESGIARTQAVLDDMMNDVMDGLARVQKSLDGGGER